MSLVMTMIPAGPECYFPPPAPPPPARECLGVIWVRRQMDGWSRALPLLLVVALHVHNVHAALDPV